MNTTPKTSRMSQVRVQARAALSRGRRVHHQPDTPPTVEQVTLFDQPTDQDTEVTPQ